MMKDKFNAIVALEIWHDGHRQWVEKIDMDDDGALVATKEGEIIVVEWFNVLDELKV